MAKAPKMHAPLPVCCPSKIFEQFEETNTIVESTDGLVDSAVILSMHDRDFEKDLIQKTYAKITAMAAEAKATAKSGGKADLLAALNNYLFGSGRFVGTDKDFILPESYYLPKVIEQWHGSPPAMGILFKAVGEKMGLQICGINPPSLFLCRVDMGKKSEMIYIDPFDEGKTVAVKHMMARCQKEHGLSFKWSEEFLNSLDHATWLSSMMDNLEAKFHASGLHKSVATMIELKKVLKPNSSKLNYDLAQALSAGGYKRQAILYMNLYLQENPTHPNRKEYKQEQDSWAKSI